MTREKKTDIAFDIDTSLEVENLQKSLQKYDLGYWTKIAVKNVKRSRSHVSNEIVLFYSVIKQQIILPHNKFSLFFLSCLFSFALGVAVSSNRNEFRLANCCEMA